MSFNYKFRPDINTTFISENVKNGHFHEKLSLVNIWLLQYYIKYILSI
jgi:hypothetical protein